MGTSIDTATFSHEQGKMIAQLALMTEQGHSPTKIIELSGPMQQIVAMLLNLTNDEINQSGISLWGGIGSGQERIYIGISAPTNALGYAVFSTQPIRQHH